MSKSYFYRAYDLTVRSYRCIPSLTATDEPESVDVDIQPASLKRPDSREDARRTVSVHEDEIVVSWKDRVTLSLQDGQRILVDQVPDSDDRITELLIAGTGLGIILHQIHRVTLHASAVATEKGAVAFIGKKRMGKSTTAAGLSNLGYPVVTDDILMVDVQEDEVWTAPGENVFKLWPDAATATQKNEACGLSQLHENTTKKIGTFSDHYKSKIPLTHIFILTFKNNKYDNLPTIKKVQSRDAYMDITKNSYSLRFLGQEGLSQWYVRDISEIVKRVSVSKLVRKPDPKHIKDTISFLEKYISKKVVNKK